MLRKRSLKAKALTFMLSLAIIFGCLPFAVVPVTADAAVSGNSVVSDKSTYDDWKEFFLPQTGKVSTENAGGIWTDKSVFTDADTFALAGVTKNQKESLLVALSAITSNMTLTGQSNIPTDTVLVLDASGSMNASNNNCAKELVDAANESIKSLMDLNKHNRVAVVIYSGTSTTSGNSPADTAVLLLPLDRYVNNSADGQYLKYTKTTSGRNTTETVTVEGKVVCESTNAKPSTSSAKKTFVGATYTQRGIMLGLEEFADADTKVFDEQLGMLDRIPIMVLMSDGVPTTCSTSYADPFNSNGNKGYNMGTGATSSATDAMGFVTQLTASYAKSQIEARYSRECLFYTMGLGNGISGDKIATSVMNPAASSDKIKEYWQKYNSASMNGTITVEGGKNDGKSIKKIAELESGYVDLYFEVTGTQAEMKAGLSAAFENIIKEITNQSKYFPNLSSASGELSDSVYFVDKIGEYMYVSDVKGIVVENKLLSGAKAAQSIASNRTEINTAVVAAIQQRLGIADSKLAEELIKSAVSSGQINYTSTSDFSNYICWYADADGNFLGFCDENIEPINSDIAKKIKSYLYLGNTDETQGTTQTDMLLAAVYVEEDIYTNEQTVMFSVPEKLLPTVYYDVSLDKNGNPEKIDVNGAKSPISLVFEVALSPEINQYTYKETVSQEYLDKNTNPDGTINFYSNKFDVNDTVGYEKDNTYSYYKPALNNDRYYYLEDTLIYTDTDGTVYDSAESPDSFSGNLYRQHIIYVKDGDSYTKKVGYHQLSQTEIEVAKASSNGQWVIPEGTVNTEHDDYAISKDENISGTLSYSNKPYVDVEHPGDVNGDKYYTFGSTHGGNGKLTFVPETGVVLSKFLAAGSIATSQAFEFAMQNVSNSNDNSIYDAYLIKSDGSEEATTVKFTNGTATVKLRAGESLYIGGMTAGDVIKITETETAEHVIDSVNGNSELKQATVTVKTNAFEDINFVNRDRSTGAITISKEITHDFGTGYQIPDKSFTFEVVFTGTGSKNATFNASKSNSTLTSVSTDANGKISFTLKNNESLTITGIPEGITAKVTEKSLANGFSAAYLENGTAGDGAVSIIGNATVNIKVVNDYNAQSVSIGNGVIITGAKSLSGRDWLPSDSFSFKLEKYDNSAWVPMGTQTVNGSSINKSFSFNSALQSEEYTKAGSYLYRITEVDNSLSGITYDSTVHSFKVDVADSDMDGFLEISDVSAYNSPSTIITKQGNVWSVKADFNNTYAATGNSIVVLSGEKTLKDKSFNDGDFTFELYEANSVFAIGTAAYKTAVNENGKFSVDLNYSASQIGNTYYYVLKEANAGETINGIKYSSEVYKITVSVEDDNLGGVKTNVIVDSSAGVVNTDELHFINTYSAKSATAQISGEKELKGRELQEGEFKFLLNKADADFSVDETAQVLVAYNSADGAFSFDELTFDSVGRYYFVVTEDDTVAADRVTFDDNIYCVEFNVTDNGLGQLVAGEPTITVKATGAVSDIKFENTYVPQPSDIFVDININKTVINKGTEELSPEGFTFELTENGSSTPLTAVTDENGKAVITLKFSESDIGSVYEYELSEVNDGKENVTYSTEKYTVKISLSLNSENVIVADISVDDVPTASVVADFTNEYDYTPDDGNGNPDDGNGNPDDGNGNPDDGNGNPDDGNGNPDDGNGNPGDGNGNPDDGNGTIIGGGNDENNGDGDETTDKPGSGAPQTGDNSNYFMWLAMFISSGLGLMLVVMSRRKEKISEC